MSFSLTSSKSLFLKNVLIIDAQSEFHLQRKNIFIENGIIRQINNLDQNQKADTEIDATHLTVSVGFCDLGTGFDENKESLASLGKSAQFGGFTDVVLTSSASKKPIQSKEKVFYLKSLSQELGINIHPIAALTSNNEGKSMSEILSLSSAGAVAFSDGKDNCLEVDILKQTLLYLQANNGLLIYYPNDLLLNPSGQIHEGKTSTMLGLKGIPAIAEEIAIEKALSVLSYTGGKIHFANISTEKSVDLIREGKKKGLQISCDIAAHQVAFSDEDLLTFDTNLKVKPPFRTKKDILALWKGIQDNTINTIVSGHSPQDQENKILEFDLAEFGILGLQTVFPILNTYKPSHISVATIIDKFTFQAREILGLEQSKIAEGEKANITLFDSEKKWTFEKNHILSEAKNTPFIGKEFKGKVINC